MDMSEDCWEHAGLLQDVAAVEPPPPTIAPDFLIQQQEVSPPFSYTLIPLRAKSALGETTRTHVSHSREYENAALNKDPNQATFCVSPSGFGISWISWRGNQDCLPDLINDCPLT